MKRMILAAIAVAGLALNGSAQSPQNQAPAAVSSASGARANQSVPSPFGPPLPQVPATSPDGNLHMGPRG